MIDLDLEDRRWAEVDLAALADQAEAAVCARFDLDAEDCEISLLACGDTRIAALNADHRGKPSATNVLSWPAVDLAAPQAGGVPEAPTPDVFGALALGDIAIAYDTCLREAQSAGLSAENHVLHLLVHGLLHLLGYDHIRDKDATLMEALEVEILGTIGVDDPYKHMDEA